MSDENCCGACGYPIHATKDKACDWCRQTANRIEALTAKLATCEKYRDAYAECDRIGTQTVRDLEAKLAAAVDWFETIRDRAKGDYMAHTYYLDALAALATIKRREP